jgi:hypothetical protein
MKSKELKEIEAEELEQEPSLDKMIDMSDPKVQEGMRQFMQGTDGQAGSVGSEKFSIAPAINTPAFKKWFGNSKVVDENG